MDRRPDFTIDVQDFLADNSAIFKRRRDRSQMHESSARQAAIRNLDALTIDRIGALGKPE